MKSPSKRGQSGFSLVELMVVVAIIGVLATIAIPRVNRFIAKSRTSEAQVNLSSLYTFNKNFYVEFSSYTNSLQVMGFRPEGNLRYNVGWAPGTGSATATYLALKRNNVALAGNDLWSSSFEMCALNALPAAQCRTLAGATNARPPVIVDGVANNQSAIGANFDTFRAIANAQLVSGAALDVWFVDENKNLSNFADGTGN